LALGDVTGDGRPDVLVLSRAVSQSVAAHVTVVRNGPGGELVAQEPLRLGTGRVGTVSATTGDFNNNGQTDLAVVQTMGSVQELTTFLADGRGGFNEGVSRPAGSQAPTFVAVADLDRDAAVDLVASSDRGVTLYSGAGESGSVNSRGASVPVSSVAGAALSAPHAAAKRATRPRNCRIVTELLPGRHTAVTCLWIIHPPARPARALAGAG